ncbi:membrane protein [Siccirubricoccus deserti]|uniref:Neutral zinc metallopeptidase n=1 Tax=Siccirubricoccus deserti TaxID=2013562 RepID=A0A9X0UFD8_9PROT|nr:neutral zinc metallopeptidase [Siccirubricoccus deserti]MBC4017758.1 neutral zinc metallopeptidase [Siccirubricoccus deserti]GGC60880.1 membrane protein [Siccirubricoccus deserti]
MRLGGQRESSNVEDRRGSGGGLPIGIAGGGLGTIALVVLALVFGVDPSVILSGGGAPESQVSDSRAPADPAQEDQRRFVAQVLATTEDVWTDVFRRGGQDYQPPNLVLFSGGTQSGCGFAQTAVGPFYCPEDRKVYLDLAFFRDMERKLGAPGDFARAYVIAHEVGHHVQNQLGILRRVEQERRGLGEAQSNAMQVRVELQADCFAGVWGNRTQRMRQVLEEGDIEEGLNAAAAVGDDRLQRRARGTVVPESFTHGSSAQRVRWFRRGLESGDVRQCDSFAGGAL